MPSLVPSSEVENCLRSLLEVDGFHLNQVRKNGETGVDILATRQSVTLHIEVIGFKGSAPARSKDFYESFFRAVSRINDEAQQCVIALPARFAIGLPKRAAHYGAAWIRIGVAFPELSIWLVDTEAKTYTPTSWNEWLNK